MKKKQEKVAAAIDIGSSTVRMHIAQLGGKSVSVLDELEKPIHIGQEVFSTGYISFPTVRALSGVLAGFQSIAREYGVTRVRAVATTALREAANRAHVLDHLAIRNHLEVQVLENMDANSLLFDAMRYARFSQSGTVLMVHAGTGTIGLALCREGQVAQAGSLHTGLLKIAEMLRETAEETRHVDLVAEQYLTARLSRAERIIRKPCPGSIALGSGEIDLLLHAMDIPLRENSASLPPKRLEEQYQVLRELSPHQVAARYDLTPDQGAILYAQVALVRVLLRMSGAQKLYCTRVNLPDALLNLQLLPGARRSYSEALRSGALASVLDMAGRYHVDLPHAQYVADTALRLFEQLRRIHGLSRRQSLLLRSACLLHEIGYYTNTEDNQEASFDLVKDAQIYGLRSHDTLLAASIIAPGTLLGIATRAGESSLGPEEELFITKMHALLHMADALDASRRQKGELTGAVLEENQFFIKLRIQEDCTLEHWMFAQSAALFEDVFGVEPHLELIPHHGEAEG